MTKHQDDLDLLLSLQDRVLETPPPSPSPLHSNSPGYLSDDDASSPKRMRKAADMSVFRDAVQDFLDHEPTTVKKPLKPNRTNNSNDAEVEKFSGLRIRNQLVPSEELSDRFSDIRFIRLPAIKNLLVGDTLSGCWATVGVLTEKGSPRTSSNGKKYAIWKIGCLDEKTISLFLFGDAYQKNCEENVGAVFALFSCGVRKDTSGTGFSLSVYSAGQILKVGTSLDYGVCKGKRKDGMACTVVINKRRGIHCTYHKSRASDKYSVTRTELKGGNLRTAFGYHHKSEGIYMVDPLADRTNLTKPKQPMKFMSVDGLKKALSNAGKVTTNIHSQGIRFLAEVTAKMGPKTKEKVDAKPKLQSSEKRSSSSVRLDQTEVRNQQPNAKRRKIEERKHLAEKTTEVREKMIELDFVSSDEEI